MVWTLGKRCSEAQHQLPQSNKKQQAIVLEKYVVVIFGLCSGELVYTSQNIPKVNFMSSFAVHVLRLNDVTPHPNAERLELAVVGGYRVVVAKGQFNKNDLVAYLPEASVLPDTLIEDLGLTGRLAGSHKNRIKAVRLRGELSQGIVMPAHPSWGEGDDVASLLGVEKYTPPIPVALAGEVYVLEDHEVLSFDIENIKKFPNVLEDGEMVSLTEKLHGTFTMVGAVPPRLARPESAHKNGRLFVSSKGLMHQRLGLKANEKNQNNSYFRALDSSNAWKLVDELSARLDKPVVLLGETFGQGIQDLNYNAKTPTFRAFALYIDKTPQSDDVLERVLNEFGIKRVPVLYKGPFDMKVVEEFTQGHETLSGQNTHMREGVVITPLVERVHPTVGRVVLKSVSEQYLLRKNATEYN